MGECFLLLGARLDYVVVLVPIGLHLFLFIRRMSAKLRILSPRCNGAAIILFRRRGFIFSLVAPGHLHSSLSAGPGTPPRKKVSTGIHRPPKLLTK